MITPKAPWYGTRYNYILLAVIASAVLAPAYAEKPDNPLPIDGPVLDWIDSAGQHAHAANLGQETPRLSVFIHLDSADSAGDLPGFIVPAASAYNIVVASLTPSQILDAASLDTVTLITMPDLAVPKYHGDTEGVFLMGADIMHAQNFTGKGVTVAVVDVEFVEEHPEIADNVESYIIFDSATNCDKTVCGGTTSSAGTSTHASAGTPDAPNDTPAPLQPRTRSHGTAVAEIIVDMAPDVTLHLYSVSNLVDFVNAVDHAVSSGADIIQASLGFDNVGPSSGNEYRAGGSFAARIVDYAEANGVLPVMAAGNEGFSHYITKYVPSTTTMPSDLGLRHQSLMEFYPDRKGPYNTCMPIQWDFSGRMIFVWDDYWFDTTNDYDIYLFDRDMERVLEKSDGNTNRPQEAFIFYTAGSGCIVVASYNSTQDHTMRFLWDSSAAALPKITRFGSLTTPADARGAISVGAVHASDNRLEYYSSSGPTDDGRLKPEICGVARVTNHQYSSTFAGTSASSPHISGLAALLMDARPDLRGTGKSQVLDILKNYALHNEDYSKDNLCGADSGLGSLAGYAGIPSPPLRLSATAQDGQVYLDWDAPADTGMPSLTDYVVQYRQYQQDRQDQDAWNTFADGMGTSTHATVLDLDNEVAYEFAVRAVNPRSVGDASDIVTSSPSGSINATVPAPPRDIAAIPSDGALYVYWNAPDTGGMPITDYIVQYRIGVGPWHTFDDINGTPTFATITGLLNHIEYTVRVNATTHAGTGSGTVIHAIPALGDHPLPGAPENPQAVAQNGQVALSWDHPTDADVAGILGYVVQYAQGSGPWRMMADGQDGSTPAIVDGLENDIQYSFRIYARGPAGVGAASDIVSATPSGTAPLLAPGAPENPQAVAQNGQVSLSWDSPADTGGITISDYMIQYRIAGGIWEDYNDGIGASTFATIRGLVNGLGYEFLITAVNQAGAGPATEVSVEPFGSLENARYGSTPFGILSGITGDWDGDGIDDVGAVGILHNGDHHFTLETNGTTHFSGTIGSVHDYLPGTMAAVTGDWDGDGDHDIGTAGVNSDGMHQFMLYSDGIIIFNDTVGNHGDYLPGTMAAVTGDWDGDGIDDVGAVGILHNGDHHFTLETNGTTHFSGTIGSVHDYLPGTMAAVTGDWDGDGDHDIGTVGIGRSGLLDYTLVVGGNGTVMVYAQADMNDYLPGMLAAVTGDWDGDGDDDVGSVGINEDGDQEFILTPNSRKFDPIFSGVIGNANHYMTPSSLTYNVTISSMMRGQPLTNPVVITHDNGEMMFAEGAYARSDFVQLAENGDVLLLNRTLAQRGLPVQVVGTSNSVFGDTNTVEFTLVTDGSMPYLSFASMLVCTNDGFTGLNSLRLPADGMIRVVYPHVYDAGTEINTEDLADIIPLCQQLTGVDSDDQGSFRSNSDLEEDAPITRHPGIRGDNDLGEINSWSDMPVSVTITRIS